jgi:hypothetical protein
MKLVVSKRKQSENGIVKKQEQIDLIEQKGRMRAQFLLVSWQASLLNPTNEG